jgi:hypothetical protein
MLRSDAAMSLTLNSSASSSSHSTSASSTESSVAQWGRPRKWPKRTQRAMRSGAPNSRSASGTSQLQAVHERFKLHEPVVSAEA